MSDPIVLEVGDVIITVTAKGQGARTPALVPPRPLPPVLPERYPRLFDDEEMRRAVGLWVMASAAKCYKADWPRLAEIIHAVADRLAGEPEKAAPGALAGEKS
jgi:hypothetical protein